MESLRGQLLVATSAIGAGPFRRSVVYILDHDEDGALGLIINRPTAADVEDILPDWADIVNAPECLFDGGPVAMDSALGVGIVSGAARPAGWQSMTGRVGLLDLSGPPPAAEEFDGLRIYLGYAGWSAGQLELELEEKSWLVVASEIDDLISADPEGLWAKILQRQEGETRYLATMPDDPTDN